MSQFEEIPSPGYGFQGSRVRKSRALAACKTLASKQTLVEQECFAPETLRVSNVRHFTRS